MLDESGSQLAQGFCDGNAEGFPDALACLVRLAAPVLDDTAGGLAVAGLEATGVSGEPECGKIGEEILGEDLIEIDLQVGGSGDADVVPEDAQLGPVGYHAPEGAVGGVEVFLHQVVGRTAATLLAEAGIGLVQIVPVGDQQEGDGALTGIVREGEMAIVQLDGSGRSQILVAQYRANERIDPVVDAGLGGVSLVAVGGDSVIPGEFFLDGQGGRETVVGSSLARQFAGGDFLQEFGGKQAPFDPQGWKSMSSREPHEVVVRAMGRNR